MIRIFALSVAVAAHVLPAIAEDTVDTSKATCEEYNKRGHNLIVARRRPFTRS